MLAPIEEDIPCCFNFHDLLYHLECHTPKFESRTALFLEDGEKISFRRLHALSNYLRDCLQEKLGHSENKNPDGDWLIGVCIKPSAEFILSVLAILKTGAGYIALDHDFPHDRTLEVINECKPAIVLISDEDDTLWPEFIQVVNVQKLLEDYTLDPSEDAAKPICPSPLIQQDVAAVIFTEGITSEPKGVRLTKRGVYNRLLWQWNKIPFQRQEVCAFKTPSTSVVSLPEILTPLLSGVPLVVFPKNILRNPELFIEQIIGFKVTRLTLHAAHLKTIIDTVESRVDLRSQLGIRVWICCGTVLPKEVVVEALKTFPNSAVWNCYGTTETLDAGTLIEFTGVESAVLLEDHRLVPVGHPIDNVHIYLLNEKQALIKENGELGEICIGGVSVTPGYINGARSNQFIFHPESGRRLFRTGDCGYFADFRRKRCLWHLGRMDAQMKGGGNSEDMARPLKSLSLEDT